MNKAAEANPQKEQKPIVTIGQIERRLSNHSADDRRSILAYLNSKFGESVVK